MKTSKKTLVGLLAATAVAATATTVYTATHPAASGVPHNQVESRVEAAVSTLEQQLQRRFHDRDNLSFGYERMVRENSRKHYTTVMGRNGRFSVARDDGQPAQVRYPERNGDAEFEVAPGVWLPYPQVKETLIPENETEKAAVETLKSEKIQVAMYTAGLFNDDGIPARLKGPAYLRQMTPTAPTKDWAKGVAGEAWKSKKSVVTVDGWTVTISPVKADHESCLNCHNSRQDFRTGKVDEQKRAYKLGDTLGLIMIGVKR